jgi:hypothetical protein
MESRMSAMTGKDNIEGRIKQLKKEIDELTA